jgi:hypothetical protein
MDWKIKTAIIGGSLVFLTGLCFIIKVQNDTITKLKIIETSVMESKNLGDNIVRGQSAYVTQKDLETLIKEQKLDLSVIKQDLGVLGANVKAFQTIKVVTPGYSGSNIQTTVVTKDPLPTTAKSDKYTGTTQWLDLTEPFGGGTIVPFGKAGFSAGQEKPWSVTVEPRTYRSDTVLGEDEDGRHFAYSKMFIDVGGKSYTVPIAENKVMEEYPSSKFGFDPSLYMGIDGGMIMQNSNGEIMPNLGVSFFSYGTRKSNPEWNFLTLGLGYASQSKSIAAFLSPANYNVGKLLPLVDNMFVGPSVSIDMNKNIGLFVGIRVGL